MNPFHLSPCVTTKLSRHLHTGNDVSVKPRHSISVRILLGICILPIEQEWVSRWSDHGEDKPRIHDTRH